MSRIFIIVDILEYIYDINAKGVGRAFKCVMVAHPYLILEE